MLEHHRLDPELGRVELVEDLLRVVGAVVAADARVVAADDEVRAAVVLARDRVPDRLARPAVAHRGGKRREHRPVCRVVAIEQRAIAVDAHGDRHVVRFRLADERVHEQPIDDLEGRLRDELVRAVDRVARLEADDPPPATLVEDRARLGRIECEIGKARRLPQEDRHLAREVAAGLRVDARDTRMCLVRGSEALLGLAFGVVLVDLADREGRERRAGLVGQDDGIAARRLRHGERHGKRPDRAVGELHLVDHALVVNLAHEAGERREGAARDHVEIGQLARAQHDPLEPFERRRALADARDERAAVGCDQVRHAGLPAGISVRLSRYASTACALSSGEAFSVSTTSSGEAGSS